MNIFILETNPKKNAQALCDQHIVKMPLETAQILCSMFEAGQAPYRRTHFNHPACIWVRESRGNYLWLIKYGLELCREYTFRYGKTHASQKVIEWCCNHLEKLSFKKVRRTKFVSIVSPEFTHERDTITAYRKFYQKEKMKFARWNRGRAKPCWLKSLTN